MIWSRCRKIIAIGLLTVIVAGCSGKAEGEACLAPDGPETFKPAFKFGSPPSGDFKRAQACVRYQAYRLAGGSDRTETVADAVMAACADNVLEAQSSIWVASYNSHNESRSPPAVQPLAADGSEGPSCAKGSPCETRSWNEQNVAREAFRVSDEYQDALKQDALFRVVEARSMNCSLTHFRPEGAR